MERTFIYLAHCLWPIDEATMTELDDEASGEAGHPLPLLTDLMTLSEPLRSDSENDRLVPVYRRGGVLVGSVQPRCRM